MERIVLEIDEAMVRKWNTLSLEQQEQLTRQFEQLVLQLFADVDNSESTKETINEPSTTYKADAKKVLEKLDVPEPEEIPLTEEERKLRVQKVRDAFSRFNSNLSNFTFNREEANER